MKIFTLAVLCAVLACKTTPRTPEESRLEDAAIKNNCTEAYPLIDKGVSLTHLSQQAKDNLLLSSVIPAYIHGKTTKARTELTEILLKFGADPNASNHLGYTALHNACGNPESTRILLKYGAKPYLKTTHDIQPLHQVGTGEVASMLIAAGADVNARAEHGMQPIYYAAGHGKIDVIIVLLRHGANIEAKDKYGRTPLHAAIHTGKLETVKYLLKNGAKIDSKFNEGRQGIHLAAETGKIDVFEFLISQGAKIDALDDDGNTALHWAAVKGSNDIVKYILKSGYNVDFKNKNGITPLGSIGMNHTPKNAWQVGYGTGASPESLLSVIILLKNGASINGLSDSQFKYLLSWSQLPTANAAIRPDMLALKSLLLSTRSGMSFNSSTASLVTIFRGDKDLPLSKLISKIFTSDKGLDVYPEFDTLIKSQIMDMPARESYYVSFEEAEVFFRKLLPLIRQTKSQGFLLEKFLKARDQNFCFDSHAIICAKKTHEICQIIISKSKVEKKIDESHFDLLFLLAAYSPGNSQNYLAEICFDYGLIKKNDTEKNSWLRKQFAEKYSGALLNYMDKHDFDTLSLRQFGAQYLPLLEDKTAPQIEDFSIIKYMIINFDQLQTKDSTRLAEDMARIQKWIYDNPGMDSIKFIYYFKIYEYLTSKRWKFHLTTLVSKEFCKGIREDDAIGMKLKNTILKN